jgi:hypothetical protein
MYSSKIKNSQLLSQFGFYQERKCSNPECNQRIPFPVISWKFTYFSGNVCTFMEEDRSSGFFRNVHRIMPEWILSYFILVLYTVNAVRTLNVKGQSRKLLLPFLRFSPNKAHGLVVFQNLGPIRTLGPIKHMVKEAYQIKPHNEELCGLCLLTTYCYGKHRQQEWARWISSNIGLELVINSCRCLVEVSSQ